MKIFKDKELTKEIENEIFELGIVEAGNSKQYTFYILNDSRALLKDLKFEVEHEEVKILEAPEKLRANDISKLLLEWNPSVTLKEGLQAPLKISGIELWG